MVRAGRDDNTEALDAFVAELAARALALRGALRTSGIAETLAQRLAPLERLTRPGQEPRQDADVAAGECAQLLALCMAHARALALCEREPSFDGPGVLRRVPTTSPLLAAIFESLLDVLEGEGAVAYLDGLCSWLGSARCERVLREHGELLPDRYDRFLSRYDAEAQRARGVYFTPPELVSFMWRSVERALEQELGVALDDRDLSFLDPAVGGGAFLVWLCDRQDAAGLRAAADGRLHGFEVMLPSYAVTHLRLAQRLLRRAPGAALPRVDLCLASALVKPSRAAVEAGGSDALAAAIRAEARAARALHEGAVDVVIGNPPYRRSSDNMHPEIAQRMGPYKRPLAAEPNLQPLSDDYVKFVRRLEVMLEQRERAVLALVTPSTYLSGRLYRAMRGSLLSTFPRADLVDLHGSARGEKPASSGRDENVFRVGQGIAVGVFRRGAGAGVRHAAVAGSRAHKLGALERGELEWCPLSPAAPDHMLVPRPVQRPEYASFPSLSDLFEFHSVAGKPGDDAVLVSFARDEVIPKLERARATLGSETRPSEAMRKLARRHAEKPFEPARVQPYAYRPFDERFVYDEPEIWTRPVRELRARIDGEPLLWVSRVVKDRDFAHVFVSRGLPDVIGLSPTSSVNCHVFPASALRVELFAAGLPAVPSRADGFAYVYAILHSPGYRRRHRDALRDDYPRIPLPRDAVLFERLAAHGARLLALHLLEAVPPSLPRFVEGGERAVRRVGEPGRRLAAVEAGRGRLHINDRSFFEDVPLGVARHRVGGYRVAFKWLQDRRRARRDLDAQDVEHHRRVLGVLAATRAEMAGIERAIRASGGWPHAFR